MNVIDPSRSSPQGSAALSRATVWVALTLAACGTTALDSEWRDPQYVGVTAAGAKILVVCAASDESVRRLCEDKVAASLRAGGRITLLGRDVAGTVPAAAEPQSYLPAARNAGATALFFTRLVPSSYTTGSRSSVGIGLGGFGGGNFGFGIGVGVPIGDRQPETVLVASASVVETPGARTIWAGSATARSASSASVQLDELAKVLVNGAEKAGVL